VRFWAAVELSLARVTVKVNPSDNPVFTIAEPPGSVAVQVVPFVLVIVMFFVVVPLW
jgi:hypothetical protein